MRLLLKWFSCLTLLLSALCWTSYTHAHPISMSSAFADVYEDHVEVEMRILLEDLVMYYDLEAAENFLIPASQLLERADDHKAFILEYFKIRDAGGRLLPGEVVSVDKSQIKEEGVHSIDLMTYAVVYQLRFEMEPNPSHLIFSQNFGGADATLPAVMDLLVTQKGVITEEPIKISPDYPYTREFDWTSEPQPLPRRWQERRQLKAEKEREYLGITSYSSIYSYIYIDHHEVRHELLLPLLTLETWLPLDRANPDILTVEEQVAAREKILGFFRDNHPVHIDGIRVRPVLDRLSFYGLNFKDFARMAPAEPVSIHTARVGIILSYSTKGTPNDLKMSWELYNESTPFLRSFIYEYDKDATQFFFVPDEPHFHWTGNVTWSEPEFSTPPPLTPRPTLKLPVISLILVSLAGWLVFKYVRRDEKNKSPFTLTTPALLVVGACFLWRVGVLELINPFRSPPELSNDKASDIFASLHRNLYRAFDYRTEDDIYEALSQSVDGKLLETIYLEVLQSLRMSEQGGAVVRVRDVDLVESRVRDETNSMPGNPGVRTFKMIGTWDVTGSVEHWGHIHSRKNRYQGVFTVAGLSTGWKLVDFNLQSEERLNFETGLRKFN